MWLSVVVLVSTAATAAPAHFPKAQAEINRLFAETGVQVQLRLQERVTDVGVADEVVHLTLKGTCDPVPQSGPLVLASVEFLDGEPRPLMKLECNRLARYIHPSKDLGLAMARVIAHELLHYLLAERGHSISKQSNDLFHAAVTVEALVGNSAVLPPAELERLQSVIGERLAAGQRSIAEHVGTN